MDFSLEELKSLLEEMGFKNVPTDHLESFAKDLSRLMRHEKHVQKRNPKISSAPASSVLQEGTIETSSSSHLESSTGNSNHVFPSRYQPPKNRTHENPTAKGEHEKRKQEQPLKPPARRIKSSEASKKKLKTDPVRLYHWYKTNWEHHGLQ